MVLLGVAVRDRKLVYIDADVLGWRIRIRPNDIARIYLRYADRIEERILLAVDNDTMTPGGLIAENRWSVAETRPANFWRV